MANPGDNIAAYDNGGMTALHWACWQRDIAEVKHLLQKGADVNAMSGEDSNILVTNTPLSLAVRANAFDIVKELLEDGANVHMRVFVVDDEHIMLTLAANNDNVSIAKLLVQYNAIFSIVEDRQGRLLTPLDHTSNKEMITILQSLADDTPYFKPFIR